MSDSSWRPHFKALMRQFGMLLTLLVIVVFFQWKTEGTLLEPLNLTNLVLQNSYIVIMALGMLLVIVSGHIDLSVGSAAGFIGALAAVLMVEHGWHWVPSTVMCLACGAVIGGAQGAFVAWLRIPSFIVTLAGMLVLKGLALWLLAGQSLGPFPETFQLLSSGFLPDPWPEQDMRWLSFGLASGLSALALVLAIRERVAATRLGLRRAPLPLWLAQHALLSALALVLAWWLCSYKGLPNVLLLMGALVAAYAFVSERTVIGRQVYALGGNLQAARLSGIRTERLTFGAFVNVGVLAALGGLVFAARLNTATPKAGLGFELDVIAACFIGGASASGGSGRVMGAVLGAFVMGVMNNGMSLLGLGIDIQQVIKGLVLLAAVLVDVLQKGNR